MKYAAYLETLTPEQRNAELISTVSKNVKRAAVKLEEEQVNNLMNIFDFTIDFNCFSFHPSA
jgi:hypothetical protein